MGHQYGSQLQAHYILLVLISVRLNTVAAVNLSYVNLCKNHQSDIPQEPNVVFSLKLLFAPECLFSTDSLVFALLQKVIYQRCLC